MPQAGEQVPGPLEGAGEVQPSTLKCGIIAGTAGKHLRHCWSRGLCVPLPVLISPDVTCPEHQLGLAEPAQAVTGGAGLVQG